MRQLRDDTHLILLSNSRLVGKAPSGPLDTRTRTKLLATLNK